jgi:hypothetical protein
MNWYATRTHFLASVFVTAFVMLGCRGDSTSPDGHGELRPGAKRVYTHRGYNGTLFTLEVGDRTLRTGTGQRVVLSETRFRQLASLFDGMNTTDSSIAQIMRSARIRSESHATPRVGFAGVGNRILSVPLAFSSSSLRTPKKQSAYIGIFDGSDLTGVGCLDIAENISVATEVYHHTQHEIDDVLVDLGLARDDEERAIWAVVLDGLEVEQLTENGQLNFLAVLYNSYDCWSNNWQDAQPDYITRFLPEDSGGGIGTCSTKWGTVQKSTDGGLTWTDLWTGWYTECET